MVFRFRKLYVLVVLAVLLMYCFAVDVYQNNINVINEQMIQEGVQLPVIMYHQITKETKRASRYVLPYDDLVRDLEYIASNGYNTVTVSEVVSFIKGEGVLPEKPIMLTFDDGHETYVEYLEPLLKQYNMKAVVSIIGVLTDEYTGLDTHNVRYSYLTWDQVRALSQRGVIEIQSHTYDLHQNTKNVMGAKALKGENTESYKKRMNDDIEKMHFRMKEHLGFTPLSAAYPFGLYSDNTGEIFKENGYYITMTCREVINTVCVKKDDPFYQLGRINRYYGISTENFFKKYDI